MTFQELFREIKKSKQEMIETAEKGINGILVDSMALVQTKSPVDTGRYRASNQFQEDTPPTGTAPENLTKANYNGITNDNKDIKVKFKPQATYYISNNVDYAEKIENDSWSTQAPEGVYGISERQMQAKVDSYFPGFKKKKVL